MADLAAETGDQSLVEACERLWDHLCTRNMYLTGGIGPSRFNEGFTRDYDLPNESAYAETCAAIGLVFWNQRMLQLSAESRYGDVLERALYNGVLSGVSLSGDRFFYENPLASSGSHHRQAWFDCACCPPNIARLLASLGGYIYSSNDSEVMVNLYVQGQGRLAFQDGEITIRQETNYPWDGKVAITLDVDRPLTFKLLLRWPGWCSQAELRLNGEELTTDDRVENGFVGLERHWQPGDQVQFEMAMPVERIYAHPDISEDVGKVALQRGPLVYCIEQVDEVLPVKRLVLPTDSPLKAEFDPNLLGGVVKISGPALVHESRDWESDLYRTQRPAAKPCQLVAIPYYAWDNRKPGAMRVWLPEL